MDGSVEYNVPTYHGEDNWVTYGSYPSEVLDEYENLYKQQYVMEKVLAKRVRALYARWILSEPP